MWYILEADEGSQLISGFNRKLDKETYIKYLQNKNLPEILNYEQVQAGDVYFMPAGRVHALGPGVLLAEIQETSDTTYRIYDWDRTDAEGNSREIHIEEALDAIDFEIPEKHKTDYPREEEKTATLVTCEHFTSNLISLEKHALEKDYSGLDSFVALLCTEGMAIIQCNEENYDLSKGELILIPAIMESVLISPVIKTKLLEIHM